MTVPEPSPWFNLTIAGIALVAPGIRWLYRRWFKRGRVEIHHTGTIEIGYGNYGPSVGIQGTLQGIDHDLFVRSISVLITREADQAQHTFEWTLFRSTQFVSTRPKEVAFALPSGFLLLPSHPFRYNIIFNDAEFRQQYVQPMIDAVRAAWIPAVQAALGAGPLSVNPQQAQTAIANAAQAAYPAFQNGAAHVDAFAELNQRFYWHAGWYRLTVQVATARPDRTFTRQWRFQLSPANEAALRLNSVKVVQEACEQYIGDYNFAFVPYQDVP